MIDTSKSHKLFFYFFLFIIKSWNLTGSYLVSVSRLKAEIILVTKSISFLFEIQTENVFKFRQFSC